MQNNGINEERLGEREEIHPRYSQLAASLLAWLNLLVTASLKLGEERDYSQSRGAGENCRLSRVHTWRFSPIAATSV